MDSYKNGPAILWFRVCYHIWGARQSHESPALRAHSKERRKIDDRGTSKRKRRIKSNVIVLHCNFCTYTSPPNLPNRDGCWQLRFKHQRTNVYPLRPSSMFRSCRLGGNTILLIKLDVVGREQTRLAVEAAEPPILVRKFLKVCQHKLRIHEVIQLTTPVIVAPSGKLNSLSSAAS